MLSEKQIENLIDAQNELNNKTCGLNWRNNITDKNRKIDWLLCIQMETGEAIDSLNWKHWKDLDKPDDIKNLKMETIDLLHFIPAMLISDTGVDQAKDILKNIVKHHEEIKEEKLKDTDTLSLLIYLQSLLGAIRLFHKTDGGELLNKLLEEVAEKEGFDNLHHTLSYIATMPSLMINILLLIIDSIEDFDLEKAYVLYMAKNALNQFRQDNGYKEGTYIKMWGDVEDNSVVQDLLAANPDIGLNELKALMTEQYDKFQH